MVSNVSNDGMDVHYFGRTRSEPDSEFSIFDKTFNYFRDVLKSSPDVVLRDLNVSTWFSLLLENPIGVVLRNLNIST